LRNPLNSIAGQNIFLKALYDKIRALDIQNEELLEILKEIDKSSNILNNSTDIMQLLI
jgi:signal transduction histidine kinase